MRKLRRWLLQLAALVLAVPSGATPIVELRFIATSGGGSVGGDAIQAAPGDLLTAEIRVITGSEGVSAYGISLEFDLDLGDEVDVVSVEELLPAGFSFSFTTGIARVQESTLTRKGQLLTFEAATLGLGPESRTFAIGRIILRATGGVATDGADLRLGLWNAGIDGLFDNEGIDRSAAASFGSASIDGVPEPATAALVALGLIAIASLRTPRPALDSATADMRKCRLEGKPMKRAMVGASIVLLASIGLAPGIAGAITFTIDPSQSSLTVTTLLLGTSPVEQSPGSLTASYQGSIEVDLSTPGSLTFGGGSLIDAIQQAGPFQPLGGPADYAGIVFVPLLGSGSGMLNGFVLDVTSGATPVGALGGFAADLASLTVLTGQVDFDVNGFLQPPFPVGGPSGANGAGLVGSLTASGGVSTLLLPVQVTFLYALPLGAGVGVLELSGQLVATAPIPEPGTGILVILGLGGLASLRRGSPRP